MLMRIFVTVIVLAAVIVGALALYLPRDQIVHLIMFRDFFDISLPILGFGALIKYLCSCRRCSNSECKTCSSSCHK